MGGGEGRGVVDVEMDRLKIERERERGGWGGYREGGFVQRTH